MDMKLSKRNQKIDDVLAQLLSYEPEKFDWYYDQLENLDSCSPWCHCRPHTLWQPTT